MKTNAVSLRVASSRCLGFGCAGGLPVPHCPVLHGNVVQALWPLGGAEGAVAPQPRLTLVSQASRTEFLLHCALVVLGNADLKRSGSGSAVGEEIPAVAPR